MLYNCGDAAACKVCLFLITFLLFRLPVQSHCMSTPMTDFLLRQLITSQRALWPKRTENYDIVKQFGDNIVATEGDEWKKHRRIANPAFSEVQ